jgi:iron complex transport system substrate-binding protein
MRRPSPRVVGLEWLDPPFATGHWVPEQVRQAGGWELLGSDGEASTQTTWDAVSEVDPEMLLLMPCGFHLQETIDAWAATRRPPGYADLTAARRGQVFALDGSAYFSRPGPRVIDGIELLAEIFDPDAFVDVSRPSVVGAGRRLRVGRVPFRAPRLPGGAARIGVAAPTISRAGQ